MARRHFASSGKVFASFRADGDAGHNPARRSRPGAQNAGASSSSSDSDSDHDEHVRAVTEHDVWDEP